MKNDYEIENSNAHNEEFDEQLAKIITKSIESAKAVWEIDGVTIYVTDIKLHGQKMSVDWFTFDNTIDRGVMNGKVETLARKLIGNEICSSKLSSKIWSTMKSILGMSGRT